VDLTNVDRTLQPILKRLVPAFSPKRIVLFGSHAKGSAKPGSDIDILLVTELNGDPTQYLKHARQLTGHTFPFVDVVICTSAQIEEAHRGRLPFLLQALENGIILYSQPSNHAGAKQSLASVDWPRHPTAVSARIGSL